MSLHSHVLQRPHARQHLLITTVAFAERLITDLPKVAPRVLVGINIYEALAVRAMLFY
jgi:hypothetical protein